MYWLEQIELSDDILDFSIADFQLWEKDMIEQPSTRFLDFLSDNRKSKIQSLSRTAIPDLKWLGIFAIVFTFAFGGAEARAQQPRKIFRIGFLDGSTASGARS